MGQPVVGGALILQMEAVSTHSVGGVVGDSTSTARRGVEAALDGTKGDASASLSGVSPALQDVSHTELSRTDSSLLFSQAGQSPTANRVRESPQVWENSREPYRPVCFFEAEYDSCEWAH